jgi:hypothetical protein
MLALVRERAPPSTLTTASTINNITVLVTATASTYFLIYRYTLSNQLETLIIFCGMETYNLLRSEFRIRIDFVRIRK